MGLIGMWKAFEEMEALGWVVPGGRPQRRPKMIAVQAAGCAPVTRAYDQGADANPSPNRRLIADGGDRNGSRTHGVLGRAKLLSIRNFIISASPFCQLVSGMARWMILLGTYVIAAIKFIR